MAIYYGACAVEECFDFAIIFILKIKRFL